MDVAPSQDTTNTPTQDLLGLSLEISTHLTANAATFVNAQAAAVAPDLADSYNTTFYSQPGEATDFADTLTDDYDDENTDQSSNNNEIEANSPVKTADGRWLCGWFDKKKNTRCDTTHDRRCEMTYAFTAIPYTPFRTP